jgi:alkylhydroperoxidase family enzyme
VSSERPKQPRIAPLPPEEWSEEQRELLARGDPARVLNIFATLVRHPDLYRRWIPFGNHVLFKSSLGPREREVAILRVGHLCRAEYEFHHHTRIGKSVGLTDADIERIKAGPQAPGWAPLDSALLRAVDELHSEHCIGDETWKALSSHYSVPQMIDLVFAVGQYTMVCMALNSFGVQIED